MAKIVKQGKVELTATLELNESELRALDALAGYGTDTFVKVFYKHMGRHYLEPHEKGLLTLFKTIREELPNMLSRAEKARMVFDGENEAHHFMGKKAL